MITIDLSILNQKGTPMFYSDIFAARPPFGIAGRIFISTDTKEFYRDTGSSWELLAGPGGGTITGSGTATQVAFFNSSSSITGNNDLWWDNSNSRLGIGNNNPASNLDIHGNNATIQIDGRSTSSAFVQFVTQGVLKWRIGNLSPSNYFQIYDNANSLERVKLENTGLLTLTGKINNNETTTAVANDGWYGVYSNEDITINAAQTFTGGNSFGSLVGRNLMRYQGNATFPNAAVPASILGTNVFNFPNAGSTITITQGTGVRAFSAINAFNQLNSVNSGTITHIAGLHVLAPYRATGGVDLTCTNYYGLLINASNERTAFTITNPWGIYQEGSSDKNYLNGTTLIGTNVDTLSGAKLQVTGSATFTSNVTANSFIKVGGTSTQYLMADGSTSTLTSPITGSGTTNYLPKFTGSTSLGNSQIFDNGTNVGIGTASVSGTYEKLAVAGGISIKDNTNAKLEIGRYNTTGAQNSYIKLGSNSNSLRITNNIDTSDLLEITNSGNLGLGVTPSAWGSPFTAIQGGSFGQHIGFQSNAADMIIGVNNYYNGTNYIYATSNGAAHLSIRGNSGFVWNIAPSGTAGNAITFTQAMTLDASGRLGIGISTFPNQSGGSLSGTGIFNGIVRISGSSTRFFTTGNGLELSVNSIYSYNRDTSAYNDLGINDAMTIKGAGNVGIGTATPTRALEVYSSNTSQTAQLIVSSGTNTKAYLGTFSNNLYLTSGGTFNGAWSTDGSNAIGAIVISSINNDSSMAFQTNNTNAAPQNRMLINGAGRVLIGTTTDNTVDLLQVEGSVSLKTNLKMASMTTSGTAGSIVNYVQVSVNGTNYLLPLYNLP